MSASELDLLRQLLQTPTIAATKRSNALAPIAPGYAAQRITANGTTNLVNATCHLSALVLACSVAGTAWTLRVQNKEATPKILIPTFTLSVPTAGLPIILQLEEPILMTSGIDLVLAGTAAGTLDVFGTYWL